MPCAWYSKLSHHGGIGQAYVHNMSYSKVEDWNMEIELASYPEIEPRSIPKWKSTWMNAVLVCLMGSFNNLAVIELVLPT